MRKFFRDADKATQTPKPPTAITVSDIDVYITHCQMQGYAIVTTNR